ncbi:unnamed protein product [Adineta ricciae]|uniref:Uncharacterized protein n=1 Tax=Adineta ricciae TaxID=249248 RepID=A0A813Y4S1_ADIRI|nr:unnamed protein product [Adineta ricciae]
MLDMRKTVTTLDCSFSINFPRDGIPTLGSWISKIDVLSSRKNHARVTVLMMDHMKYGKRQDFRHVFMVRR